MAVFSAKNLSVSINGTPILKNVSFSLAKGEILGLVGESGSGKSMSALAAMQLLPDGATQDGSIRYKKHEIVGASERTMNEVRGRSISMVFQEPMTALNPTKTIGDQVSEGLLWHFKMTRQRALERTQKVLERVGLPFDNHMLDRYPHQLSGGQRQRVVIAMAIACKPRFLIADEPTTALDVTIQAQILALLKEIVRKDQMSLLLISHDLAVVADMADRVAIMKDGEIVEHGPTGQLFRTLSHPYSQELVEASSHIPKARTRPLDPEAKPLLAVEGLVRTYPLPKRSVFEKRQYHTAVNTVSLRILPHESVGLVGESGCGKSTLARTVLGLEEPTKGHISFLGKNPFEVSHKEGKALKRGIQAVFQDPYGSFDPRHTIAKTVAEPLHLLRHEISETAKNGKVIAALEAVGLKPQDAHKYPHEFSGGQRQRIAIARALVTEPQLIVADEPVSALDVSIRAQILDLLADLRDRLGVAYLFISHDLSVVQAITDRVIVMNGGRIVEEGSTEQVFRHPKHPYTRMLVAAAPDLNASLKRRHKAEIKARTARQKS
ncbi:dipeptide ABC transporter ATP-binding protein [Pseudovibrio sp. SPO723]|uniref:ABC transporter ATP-binding protein n=1 Tax=Nesiotobacter zosterae TaxID=392721 RepID=UPI0029C2F3EA|nr:dipeptide ABC transporter ATP-binding protein [Pseudovibrio sp. SPO723]MDX5593587.1 dipeptide ABC transporter ATP-binding protein [Pseudovibrio sp. SPO723]